MGERKVLNKYFPPDFDPAKLPRGKRPDNNMMKVRMMLPMSIRCGTCGTYMYKGTKFNTRKEDVEGENYLGIQVFRFYFRCSACAAEISMKTDPENSDYTMEQGASRNYEPWREKDKEVAQAKAQREEEEKGNAMKALENRTLDSKREMDIMNALDEVKSLKARQEGISTDALLAALKRSDDEDQAQLDKADEAMVRQMLLQQRSMVRRIEESEDEPATANAPSAGAVRQGAQPAGAAAAKPTAAAKKPPVRLVVKPKRKADAEVNGHAAQPDVKKQAVADAGTSNGAAPLEPSPEDNEGGSLLGGLAGYGSDSD